MYNIIYFCTINYFFLLFLLLFSFSILTFGIWDCDKSSSTIKDKDICFIVIYVMRFFLIFSYHLSEESTYYTNKFVSLKCVYKNSKVRSKHKVSIGLLNKR